MLTSSDIYRKERGFVLRKIGDQIILKSLNCGSGKPDAIYSLNQVGAFIYENIDGLRDIRQINILVSNQYDTSIIDTQADVSEFIKELEGSRIICNKTSRNINLER